MKNKKTKIITLVASITSLSVITIYLINKLIFFKAKLKERLFDENGNYYNWRYGKIFYIKKGSGTPLLLIHDLDCSGSAYEWKKTIHHFAKNHTVYAIDLLGCGRSEKPKLTYTNYLYVQLISDFTKNVIKHSTNVIATGSSSSSIIMSCYMDSSLFQHIILVNPPEFNNLCKYPKYPHKLLKHIIETPILGTMIYNMASSKSTIKDAFKKKYFFDSSKISKKEIEAYYESAHLSGSNAKFMYSSIRCHYTNTNIYHAFTTLNNNICVIFGDMIENVTDLSDHYICENPAIDVEILPDCKFLPQLENPNTFVKLCEIYLDE